MLGGEDISQKQDDSVPDATHPRFLYHSPNNGLRAAFIQLTVGKDKSKNIAKAIDFIRNAKNRGVDFAVLPECFNSPYGIQYFNEYAEEIPGGITSKSLSDIAKETNLTIVGGSIPERSDGQLYNTCTVWNGEGKLIAKHRKIHLFDIDIPDKITFKESEILSAGSSLNTFNIGSAKIGLGICYDLRFEEMSRLYAQKGCNILLYPGAFNMTTGPLHWELLTRSRANDLQLYVGVISPARDVKSSYIAYGHSLLVNPWGKVEFEAGHNEELLIVHFDLSLVDIVRNQIPKVKQRRTDLYDTISKSNL